MRRVLIALFVGLFSVGFVGADSARGQALLTSEPHLAIPDDGGAPACVDTITFTQTGDTIGAFRVGLAIGHTSQAHLRVLLLPPGVVWPSSTYSVFEISSAVAAGAIELVANAGDDSDDIGYGWLQPYSYTSLTTAGDPVFDPGYTLSSISTAFGTGLAGEWLAEDEPGLAAVYGNDPADYNGQGGTWTLVVIDDTATEDGTLVAWQLEYDVVTVDPPEILVLRNGPVADGSTDYVGEMVAGIPEVVTYNIGNTGLGMLHVTDVSTAAATNCTVTVLSAVPFAVGPSDASMLELEVTPLGDGPLAFDLEIHNDDADENPYRIHVTALADLAPYAVLHVTGVVDFEAPAVSTPVSEDWQVENLGSEELVVESIAVEGRDASAFVLGALPGLPLHLAPGASANLSVIYLAPSTDDASAAVRMVSNSGGTAGTSELIQLNGTVTPDATQTGTPLLVVEGDTTFRTEDVGQFESTLWMITNDGDADLVISGMFLTGAHVRAFGIDGLPVPATLAPGASVPIQVTFLPSDARSHSAEVVIVSNHGGEPGTRERVWITGLVTGTVEDPGCNCRGAGGPTGGGSAGLIFLMALGVLLWRRRRSGRC